MPQRTLPYFQRAALVVSDIDKSLLIYRDILGFSLEYLGIDTPDSYGYEVFKIDNSIQTRFATLSSVQQQRTLALIEVPNIKIYESNQTRISAVVIQVKSVEKTRQKLIENKIETLRIVKHDAPNQGLARQEMGFYDFDGHLVVIYEILNA
jgi:catechol 2,3-dioxygenase-like lactoylglutathione lyase family enzyme